MMAQVHKRPRKRAKNGDGRGAQTADALGGGTQKADAMLAEVLRLRTRSPEFVMPVACLGALEVLGN
ncbi:unnamed protein product [Calypogeia fissa]